MDAKRNKVVTACSSTRACVQAATRPIWITRSWPWQPTHSGAGIEPTILTESLSSVPPSCPTGQISETASQVRRTTIRQVAMAQQLAIATASRKHLEDLGYFQRQDQQQRREARLQPLQDRMASALRIADSSRKATTGSSSKQSPNELDEKCQMCDGTGFL